MTAYTFDQIIDFTRTSAATYVANTGFVTQTPASRNLLTYTQEFDNAAWVKTNATVVPNQNPAAASLGSEVVANGGFDSSASWSTPVAGASITGGALTFDGVTSIATGGITSNTPAVSIVPGRLYAVTYTITGGTTNLVSVDIGGTSGTARSAAGTYTEYLVASSSTAPGVSARGSVGVRTGSIDNISVREVVGGWNVAPDGTSTADTLLATAGTASHNLNQSGGGSGSALTLSVFAKAGASNFVQLYHGSSSNMYANFNLSTGAVGTVGSSATAAITSVGNGWYRCSMTCTPGSASASRVAMITSATAAYNESWAATGTESVLIWGAQLELGALTDYTRNFGGLFPPRFDYDPVTLAPRGLLVEEQRTNLLLRSEEFENASWVKTNATVTANAAVSPDGTADADRLVDTVASAFHFTQQSATVALGANTFSCFLKAGAIRYGGIHINDGTSRGCSIDLQTGTLGTPYGGATASVVSFGNGWYRLIVTATVTSTSVNAVVFLSNSNALASYTGDGTSGIYLWGAQLEAGAFATSYIPTVASQVTRTADIATITGANFSNWYNQSQGTLVVEADTVKPPSVNATALAIDASDGDINNRHYLGFSTGLAEGRTAVGGVTQASLTQAYTANATEKLAYAYNTNDFAFARNGSLAGTDASGSLPTLNRLFIGNAAGSAAYLNGHIRGIKYYPTRLSNAQLQALTA